MNLTKSAAIDETRRRQFESAWIDGHPAIGDYLPSQGSKSYLATLEELVMIDLEFRWKDYYSAPAASTEQPPNQPLVENYLAQYDDLRQPAILKRLVQQEFQVRCRYGNAVSSDSYCRRFPDLFTDTNAAEWLNSRKDTTSSHVTTGQQLGKYQLIELHARGGFGEIWRAYDPVLERYVALKTLTCQLVKDERIRRRFVGEARTTAQLEHPGVVSVHDMSGIDSEVPFYTMQLIGGETLADAIKNYHQAEKHEDRALQRVRLLSVFRTIIQTVEFAHTQGVIHRDLKPQNIILGEFGETAILDWGLAKNLIASNSVTAPQQQGDINTDAHPSFDEGLASHDTPRDAGRDLTVDGTMIGTPAYMSPEQAAGRVELIDERSDQYCLGVILFEILTGVRPATDDANQDPFSAYRGRGVERMPHPLRAICLRAMATEREHRYESVSDLKGDLELYLADEPVSAYQEPISARLMRRVKRHRTMVSTAASALIVAAMLLSLGIVLLLDANQRLGSQKQQTQEALDEATRNMYGNFVALSHAELLKNNVVRADQLLNECPPGLRHWEWHHLKWMIEQHRPAFRLKGHDGFVKKLSFNPDSSRVAAASLNGPVIVWDTASREELTRLNHGSQARCVAFSPDGRRLATGGDDRDNQNFHGSLKVWNLNSGESLAKYDVHGEFVASVVFSPQGDRLITGGADGTLRIWDAATLDEIESTKAHKGQITDVVLKPDEPDTQLVSCGKDGRIRIWQLANLKKIVSFRAHQGTVWDCCLTRDCKYLASAGNDRLIKVWDVQQLLDSNGASVAPHRILAGHTDQVRTLDFSSDGETLVSGGLDRTIQIWDVASSHSIRVIRSHTSHIQTMQLGMNDQYLASAGDAGDVHVWKDKVTSDLTPTGHIVAFAPQEARMVAATKSKIAFWDAGQLIARIADVPAEVLKASFDREGDRCAITYRDGTIKVLDAASGNELLALTDRKPPAYSIVFHPDNRRLASGHTDNVLRVWDSLTGELLRRLEIGSMPYRLAFGSADQLLIGSVSGSLSLWRFEEQREEYKIRAHQGYLLDMAQHPSQRWLATTGADGLVKIWNWTDGKLIRSAEVGASWLNCLRFTPDGNRLVTGSEHTITFWDPDQLREVLSMSLTRCVHEMAFTPDGRTLALAGEHPQIRLWQGDIPQNDETTNPMH